jgi:hypothetical protein
MHLPRPTRWRAFASTRYRPFQAIAVGQAFTASYASDALFVPVLLRLSAPAALVVPVGAAPVGGAALQALAPQILRRLKGNLRRLTLGLPLPRCAASSSPQSSPAWPPAPWRRAWE